MRIGHEFPLEYQGCITIIKRALYGGESTGADYWKHMRTCMGHLNYSMQSRSGCLDTRSCQGDRWESILGVCPFVC